MFSSKTQNSPSLSCSHSRASIATSLMHPARQEKATLKLTQIKTGKQNGKRNVEKSAPRINCIYMFYSLSMARKELGISCHQGLYLIKDCNSSTFHSNLKRVMEGIFISTEELLDWLIHKIFVWRKNKSLVDPHPK